MTINTSLIKKSKELTLKDKVKRFFIVLITSTLFAIAFSNLSFSFERFHNLVIVFAHKAFQRG